MGRQEVHPRTGKVDSPKAGAWVCDGPSAGQCSVLQLVHVLVRHGLHSLPNQSNRQGSWGRLCRSAWSVFKTNILGWFSEHEACKSNGTKGDLYNPMNMIYFLILHNMIVSRAMLSSSNCWMVIDE